MIPFHGRWTFHPTGGKPYACPTQDQKKRELRVSERETHGWFNGRAVVPERPGHVRCAVVGRLLVTYLKLTSVWLQG